MTRVPTASTPAFTLTSGLTSTLAGKATMTSNSASTVSALPYETSTCTLSTFPQTPASSCTRTPGSASSCTRTPAPTTESTPASQHGSGTTSDSTIDSLGMAWTRATLVRAALFSALLYEHAPVGQSFPILSMEHCDGRHGGDFYESQHDETFFFQHDGISVFLHDVCEFLPLYIILILKW